MKPLQIVALLSAVAVVGMGIQTLAGGKGTLLAPSDAPRAETKALRDIVSEDADQDGLPNWEEFLWGTDPRETDSDKDGVPDGEDVARRRAKLSPAGTAALTETDRLARDFFATAVSLQSSGKLTQGTIESLSEGLARKIGDAGAAPAYTPQDLSVVPANKATLVEFGKALVGISAQYRAHGLGEELGSLEGVIQREDRAGLAGLDERRPLYEALARDLMNLSVPEPLAGAILAMANASVEMSDALRDIQSVFDDSAVALSALLRYTRAHSDFDEALNSIGEYYKKNAMIFDKK